MEDLDHQTFGEKSTRERTTERPRLSRLRAAKDLGSGESDPSLREGVTGVLSKCLGIFFHRSTKRQKLRGKTIDKEDMIC